MSKGDKEMGISKHTPGPWSYWSGYNPWDKIEAQITAEGGDIVIASYNHYIPEGEANAQLLAAAPELLEALDEAIEELEKYMNTHHPDGRDGARDFLVKLTRFKWVAGKAKGDNS